MVQVQLLYLVLTMALSWSIVAWYEQNIRWWTFGVVVAIMVSNVVHVLELWSSRLFRTGFTVMQPNSNCCCPCNRVDYSLWWLCCLRFLSGVLAAVSMSTTLLPDITSEVQLLTWLWSLTAVVWLLSCIPAFVCLVQCAAYPTRAEENNKMVTLKYFRTQLAIRLVHDGLLGIFWLYLAIMLDKLVYETTLQVGEPHAEEWRIVFMSMISWHLVVVLLRAIYFSKERALVGGCCDKKNTWLWLKTMRILSIGLLYAIIIDRVNDPVLYTMGCSELTLVGTLITVVLFGGAHAYSLENQSQTTATAATAAATAAARNQAIALFF